MKPLAVACASLSQTPLDWEGNKQRIIEALVSCQKAKVQLVCLPELAVSGYGCEDLFFSPHVQRTALEVLGEIIPYTKGLSVGLGLPLYVGSDCFNAVAFLVDGRLVGFVCKQYLARDGLYYEPRWFRAWPKGRVAEVRVLAERVPVGDLYFQLQNPAGDELSIGFEICEDAWGPTRPGARLAAAGVHVILNPSASHFAFGRFDIRKRFVIEGSRSFGVSYLYSNLLGNEAGRVVYDGSQLIASGGELIAQGERFQCDDFTLLTAHIDLDSSRVNRQRSADVSVLEGGTGDTNDHLPRCVEVRAPWIVADVSAPPVRPTVRWESSEHIRFEEFARAQGLALLDYLRKSKSHGFVVSLSGGADSAAVVCLVRLMLEFGARSIGIERLKQRLGGMAQLSAAHTVKDLVQAMLLTVYQATQNSSQTTRVAARSVAEAIGAQHIEWDVQPLVESYRMLAEQALERALTWDKDDLALQNIQSRVRAPGVWMLANVRRALLLATSNRSEVALGYATMDGDTAGGVSPLAGIDKDFIRKWLVWLETVGPEGIGPIPALSFVNAQAPTAELRPQGSGQTDEGDLMPYEILERIESCMVEQGNSPSEILSVLSAEYRGVHSVPELTVWIERFMTLFTQSQWKRERYAPGFHVDTHNLDPRSWYRFPILSGGFKRELAAIAKTGTLQKPAGKAQPKG